LHESVAPADRGLILPGLFIEIDRQEPAGLVLQKRIDSDCMIPDKMASHNVLGKWPELSGLAINFLAVLVFGT
jgi:hypothetical protein